MPSVFVFGITGYIGNAVARRFQTAGYRVSGLVRTEEKAKLLRQQEIHPVIGTAQNVESWKSAVARSDIIIEALADYQDHSTAGIIQKELLETLKNKEKLVIYTSGVWIYGNTTEHTNEKSVPISPDLVASRPAFQKVYLDAGAVVVAPSNIYGYKTNNPIINNAFKVTPGKEELPGYPDNEPVFASVHVDDLADAYLKVAQKGISLRGEYFILTVYAEVLRDLVKGVAKVSNHSGNVTFVAPQDPYSKCFALVQKHFDNSKARIVLGWNPTHSSLVSDAARYYHVWNSYN